MSGLARWIRTATQGGFAFVLVAGMAGALVVPALAQAPAMAQQPPATGQMAGQFPSGIGPAENMPWFDPSANLAPPGPPRPWSDYGWNYGYSYFDPLTAQQQNLQGPPRPLGYEQAGFAGPAQFPQHIQGQVLNVFRTRARGDQPEGVRVRLRTAQGQVRTIFLGDVAYVEQTLPSVRPGDQVQLSGDTLQTSRGLVFQARWLDTQNGGFAIPNYQFNREIVGRITDLRTVPLANGQGESVLALIRTPRGRDIQVMLGAPEELERRGELLERGTDVTLGGYTRTIGNHTTFFIQNMSTQPEAALAGSTEPAAVTEQPSAVTVGKPMKTTVSSGEQVEGLVQNIQTRKIHGDKHLLVKLERKGRPDIWVDLGPSSETASLALNRGQFLKVFGYRETAIGRTMIRANSVADDSGQIVWSAQGTPALAGAMEPAFGEQEVAGLSATPMPAGPPAYFYPGPVTANLGREVSGRIQTIATRRIAGERHDLIKLERTNARDIWVDVGPRGQAANLGLATGQFVTAYGMRTGTTVTGRTILRANEIDRDGQVVYLAPGMTPQNESAVALAGSTAPIGGTIRNLHSSKVAGETRLIGDLTTDDGNRVRVDLGPKDRLSSAIRDGDNVVVSGTWQKQKGKTTLRANEVDVNGQIAYLEGGRVPMMQFGNQGQFGLAGEEEFEPAPDFQRQWQPPQQQLDQQQQSDQQQPSDQQQQDQQSSDSYPQDAGF